MITIGLLVLIVLGIAGMLSALEDIKWRMKRIDERLEERFPAEHEVKYRD